jgi:hypothetical protein
MLYDLLKNAITHNEFSVFDTHYSCSLPKPQLIYLFQQACRLNRYQMLDVMVERGFDIKDATEVYTIISHTEEYEYKLPIIFDTLNYGSERALEFLLSHGLSPDVIHPNTGHTAVFEAGVKSLKHKKYLPLLSLLLKYNADINILSEGKTLLDYFSKEQLIELRINSMF